MTHDAKDAGRIGRAGYWLYYVGITVLTLALYGWGLYEFISFHVFPIVFGFIAPFILSLYLRVIAMRRCRDIGWSAFLPWLTMGLTMVWGAINGLQVGLHPASALGMAGATLVVGALLGLADFIFLIVIGFIAGADGGGRGWGGDGPRGGMQRLDAERPSTSRLAAMQNAALAQRAAMPAHPVPGFTPPRATSQPGPTPRTPTGFGRRGL
jgi:uncharacterized membrane protein YhaH (DUF805 family)